MQNLEETIGSHSGTRSVGPGASEKATNITWNIYFCRTMKGIKETRKACASPQIGSINMKGTYHISMCFVCPLPSLTRPPPLRTARACRDFIAATGDMGGRHECRQCIFSGWGQGQGGWQEEWNRGRGVWEAGELLEFEGHHFRSINVRHSALLSDIIKRLSPHSGRQSISHNVCRHLFFSKSATEKKHLFLMLLCCLCMNLPGRLPELHYLFTLLSQGTAAKNVKRKTKNKHVVFAAVLMACLFLPYFPSDTKVVSTQ